MDFCRLPDSGVRLLSMSAGTSSSWKTDEELSILLLVQSANTAVFMFAGPLRCCPDQNRPIFLVRSRGPDVWKLRLAM